MKHLFLLISLLCTPALAFAKGNTPVGNLQYGDHYLYCHMSDKGEWTAYAVSKDGVHFEDIINGDSIFSAAALAKIEGGTRDAFITRRADGNGYIMVTTDMKTANGTKIGKKEVWDNYGIDLMCSDDLIHWTSTTFDFRKGVEIFSDPKSPSVYKDWSNVNRVWAPQIFWDASYKWPDGQKGGYFIYFSMWNRSEEKYDRMYYSYADASFTKLTQPNLLFDWGYATIDADINYLESDGKYHMMIKKEGGKPGLFTSSAPSLKGPWSLPVDDDYISFEGSKLCEGVSAFRFDGDDTWHIGYVEYSSKPHRYCVCEADKYMRNFKDPHDIIGVTAPQHGSFMRITEDEYNRLKQWSDEVLENKTSWRGKRVGFLGDSMTDPRNDACGTHYWGYLSQMLDIDARVYAKSGYTWENIYNLAQDMLKTEKDSLDAVFIWAGTNDYMHDTPMGEFFVEKDSSANVYGKILPRKHRDYVMDTSTFCGRINRMLSFLKKSYPHQQIVIMTPIHRAYANFSTTKRANVQPDELFCNGVGLYIDDYVNAIKRGAELWSIPVIDLYSISGIFPLYTEYDEYIGNPSTDRLHPSNAGHKRLAETIKAQLRALPATFK